MMFRYSVNKGIEEVAIYIFMIVFSGCSGVYV